MHSDEPVSQMLFPFLFSQSLQVQLYGFLRVLHELLQRVPLRVASGKGRNECHVSSPFILRNHGIKTMHAAFLAARKVNGYSSRTGIR